MNIKELQRQIQGESEVARQDVTQGLFALASTGVAMAQRQLCAMGYGMEDIAAYVVASRGLQNTENPTESGLLGTGGRA